MRCQALRICVCALIIALTYAAKVTEVTCSIKYDALPYECHENTLSVHHVQNVVLPTSKADRDVYAYSLSQFSSETVASSVRTVARLVWDDVINATGWSFVTARSSAEFRDDWQLYASGYLEGYVTADRITQSLTAQNQTMFESSKVSYSDLNIWMKKQQQWMLEEVATHPEDAFWRAVGLSHHHIVGMRDGYTAALKAKKQPVLFDLVFWNQRADIDDIMTAIGPQEDQQSCSSMPPELFRDYERRTSHCSVRLTYLTTPSGEVDFAVAHNTWDDYRSMLRTWKNYIFPLALPLTKSAALSRKQALDTLPVDDTPARATNWLSTAMISNARQSARKLVNSHVTDEDIHNAMEAASWSTKPRDTLVSQSAHKLAARIRAENPYLAMLSSYPGIIQSIDDFYMLPRPEQRLIVTETTNSICNADLYKFIVPSSLLTWHRVVATNMLAAGGEAWTNMAMRENSGTYNNQFMVVDAKHLPSKPDADKLHAFAWIVEQYPGGYERQSIGAHIAQNLGWSSYNRPYFPNVFKIMGFADAQAVYGDYYSYDKTARAVIFARETADPSKYTLENLKRLMRFNQFQTDPLSQGDPTWALAARYDLLSPDKEYFSLDGAIDVKISTVRMMGGHVGDSPNDTNQIRHKGVEAVVISSPTSQDQPAFSWAPYPQYLRPGIPTVMDFDWVTASLSQDA